MKTWAMEVNQFPKKHVAKCIWKMFSNIKYILYIWHNCISLSNLLFHMMVDVWLSDSDIKCTLFL